MRFNIKKGKKEIDHGILKFSYSFSVLFVCLFFILNFPGVDFLGTALKFRKRKKISSSLVYVLHKTCN